MLERRLSLPEVLSELDARSRRRSFLSVGWIGLDRANDVARAPEKNLNSVDVVGTFLDLVGDLNVISRRLPGHPVFNHSIL